MDYVKGIFKNRPNRFIAEVEVGGNLEIAHVPNTGRCKELLVDDAVVWLKVADNPKRKTRFSLHFVENKNVLVSLYSQQANTIVYDAVIEGKIKELNGYSIYQREKTIDNSRIDIYLENETEECYVEVKGVTLIVDGEARFPDAPTERGSKHLKELIKLKKEGNRCVVFFLIQHPVGKFFRPNWENDPKFSQTLNEAYEKGVEILVYRCDNQLDGINLIPEALDFDLGKSFTDGIVNDK
ncbi:sugar fermentation stimulation protein A [Methanobrevibacter gottschalkii]|uniref:Sugar fermentation stimulation protein homolog n=2 Tax=Methanobrevibacter gottschalkii TaxID=190974 RepID=A0A3N5B5L2_9EURY|nr:MULTISPECIES: DNA/RNA nuclease SfsA [Methanobrevibacter]OEC93846.1 sugar fermentation stimulation protein SfsA [Methanobrevibacter sp. A27]RPF52684.1 sugar fermentation stimulation protein A [Methanobrevibacter gottschalkii DSM 11977]SEK27583.1 sugar fermentation stimulation protein A [Methanobrevibacter gottschalkii]